MNESQLQTKLRKRLDSIGAFVYNVHGNRMQRSGMPDLQIYHRIWTGHIELKVDGREFSPKQKRIMRDLERNGAEAYMLRYCNQTESACLYGHAEESIFLFEPGFLRWHGRTILQALRDVKPVRRIMDDYVGPV